MVLDFPVPELWTTSLKVLNEWWYSLPWVRSAFGNVLNLHRPLLLTKRIYVAISFYYRYRIEIQIRKHLSLKKVMIELWEWDSGTIEIFHSRHNFSAWRNNRWLLANYFTITSWEKGGLVSRPKGLANLSICISLLTCLCHLQTFPNVSTWI